MGSGGGPVNIAFGFVDLWPALAGGYLPRQDSVRQSQQPLGQYWLGKAINIPS